MRNIFCKLQYRSWYTVTFSKCVFLSFPRRRPRFSEMPNFRYGLRGEKNATQFLFICSGYSYYRQGVVESWSICRINLEILIKIDWASVLGKTLWRCNEKLKCLLSSL